MIYPINQSSANQTAINSASAGLSAHGFVLSNREWAAIVWFGVFVLLAIRISDARSSLIDALRIAASPKLLPLWIAYALWLSLFVQFTDWFHIWRPILTKDTFVWGITSGLALLAGFAEASKPGYFRRAFRDVVSAVVLVEYLVSFASFSFWWEMLLQPVLASLVIKPTAFQEPKSRETWSSIRPVLSIILGSLIIGNSAIVLYTASSKLNLELVALRLVWPILMGLWVLILVYPLAAVASYEEVFVQLELYRDNPTGLWKAKLGLMLALGPRLKRIRRAARSSAGTYHVAHTDSVSEAYETAKEHRNNVK